MNLRASSLAFLLVSLGALPAQLIPKNLEPKRPAVPTRLTGDWLGKAQEQLEGGRSLDYDVSLQFTGADDALRLEVRATVPVDTGQGKVTVSIVASYRGTFRAKDLRMRSEAIEVKVQETGERIPSEPQTVEGTLVDGVLSGRIGSDGDGWTKFTARAKGDEQKPIPKAATELRGRWSGTASERGPDGKELRYPIRVEFRGSGDRLTADVAADLRYPVENGTTPVEYRASFRGSQRGDEIQLTSEQVTIKLVELGRTEQGPRQEFAGTLKNGVLTGRVGSAGGEVTTLELRAEGAEKVDEKVVEEVRDDRVQDDERIGDRNPLGKRKRRDDSRPVGDDVTPGPDSGGEQTSDPKPRSERRELPKSYRTVVLEPRQVRDAGAGNVVSHTLRLPRGFELAAAPEWRAFPDSFVNFVGELRGREGEAITFAADHVFTYRGTQSQFGNQSTEQQAWTRDGQATRRPPNGPGDVAVELLVPFLRPGASDVKLVDAGRDAAREASFRAMCASTIEAFEALARNANGNGNGGVQSESKTWLASERSRVRYREGGRTWEEEFECSLVGMHGSSRIEGMMADNGVWIVCGVRSFRAPLGELDVRLPLLVVVADSVRETPRWALGVSAIKLELAKARTQQLRLETAEMQRRLAERAAANAQLRDDELATWRRQQAAGDRMHEANVQALTETQKFRDADGNTHTVTNHYDRAYRNPDDTILLTNDPNYRPEGDPNVNQVRWEELQRVDPFRPGR